MTNLSKLVSVAGLSSLLLIAPFAFADESVATGIARIHEAANGADPVVETRTYEIRDLLTILRASKLTKHAVPGQSNMWFPSPEQLGNTEAEVDELTALVMDSVDSESWKNNGGLSGSLQVMGTSLVISNTTANLARIDKLLTELRGPTTPYRLQLRWIDVPANELDAVAPNRGTFRVLADLTRPTVGEIEAVAASGIPVQIKQTTTTRFLARAPLEVLPQFGPVPQSTKASPFDEIEVGFHARGNVGISDQEAHLTLNVTATELVELRTVQINPVKVELPVIRSRPMQLDLKLPVNVPVVAHVLRDPAASGAAPEMVRVAVVTIHVNAGHVNAGHVNAGHVNAGHVNAGKATQ
jgi:hypothetical protein